MLFKKIFSIFLLFTCSLLTAEDDVTIVKDLSKLPVLTPSMLQRETQKIRLDNGLEAYLISDPDADLSGAMMSVKVGSWEDPIEHQGLAHFLEHMLFLGTLKYPKESEYQRFINEHGGQSNAFTSSNSTNYLFTINKSGFREALQRFSSFFKEPLFNASGVARELQAIDQEYAKNLENDAIREIYVMKELSSLDHPFHYFNMGNSESLASATREDLETWFRQHYSANLMRLVVYSFLPMDKLRELVIENFWGISNKDRDPPTIVSQALPSDLEGQLVYIEPLKDTRTLSLVWELPPKFAEMRETQPDRIVCFVLGHEGEKSLLAQLKREKLAESLACGGIKLGSNLEVLYLQIELTEDGLRDVDQVITRCFQTIKGLKDQGVPSYLFDEIQRMATIQYQYQSKENEFMMLMKHAYNIQDEDFATYPEATHVIQRFDQPAVAELIDDLTPENARFFVMAPSKLTTEESDRKERWLGANYGIKPITKKMMDQWGHVSAHSAITVPPPNIFIPDDLRLVYDQRSSSDRLVPVPMLLIDDARSRIYFAHDDHYGIPKVRWILEIKTPQINMGDPQTIVLGDLYIKSLKDALEKISYPAKMAGLEYGIKRKNNGIELEIQGYSQNAPLLLKEVLAIATSLEPTAAKYKIYKNSLLRKYQNFMKESPLNQSIEQFRSVIYKEFVTEKEKATAIRKVSFKKFKEYLSKLFDQTYVEGLLYGNLSEETAREISNNVRSIFEGSDYPKKEHLKNAVIVLPNEQGPYYLESRTKSQGNAVVLGIESESFSFKERAAQQILMQAIKEPFF